MERIPREKTDEGGPFPGEGGTGKETRSLKLQHVRLERFGSEWTFRRKATNTAYLRIGIGGELRTEK